MTRIRVLYQEIPKRSEFRFVAWLWLIERDGTPNLQGASRKARTLPALRNKLPPGCGPDPRFIARKWHAPSDVGTRLIALEGWTQ